MNQIPETRTAMTSAAPLAQGGLSASLGVDAILKELPYASELSQDARRAALQAISEVLNAEVSPAWIPATLIRLAGGGASVLVGFIAIVIFAGSIFGWIAGGLAFMLSILCLVRAPLSALRSARMRGPRQALDRALEEKRIDSQQHSNIRALQEAFNDAN